MMDMTVDLSRINASVNETKMVVRIEMLLGNDHNRGAWVEYDLGQMDELVRLLSDKRFELEDLMETHFNNVPKGQGLADGNQRLRREPAQIRSEKFLYRMTPSRRALLVQLADQLSIGKPDKVSFTETLDIALDLLWEKTVGAEGRKSK